MSEGEEVVEEVEETPEALEEAPPDFIVDVAGLEAMVKISDLLFEAARSSEPMKYIQEIEKLGSAITTKEKRRKERVSKERKVSEKRKTTKKKKAG